MLTLVRLFALLLFACAFGSYVTPKASAQEKAGGKTTVTGCLQKGDEAGEYSITVEDGKMYGLRSQTVKLSQHVGHKDDYRNPRVRIGREGKGRSVGTREEGGS